MTARKASALALILGGLTASALGAGGFQSAYQSSKAMAMGGASVAQAEDPSAVYYNVGALAFLGKKAPILSAGVAAFNLNASLYQGLPPGIGGGTNGEQDEVQDLLPHAYAAVPLGDNGKLGFGVYSPFAIDVLWADKDNFPGRFLSLATRLNTTDLTVGVSYKVSDTLGVGAAAVYRTSDLKLLSRVPSFDPSAGQVVDVASLKMEATLDDGVGWSSGLLFQLEGGFSVGLAYHSAIEIEYDGEARLTQIPTGNTGLDALIAATLPLDQDLSFRSMIEFPATAAIGVALPVGETMVVEVGSDWTEWSVFQDLDLLLPNNPEFNRSQPQNYIDSMTYRIGGRMEGGSGSILRFGISMDETPQPPEALGPFLPDGERLSYSLGYSKDWLDLAFVWVEWQNRETVTNIDDFNGIYSSNAWILGLTINI